MKINNINNIREKIKNYIKIKSGQYTFKEHFLRLEMTPTSDIDGLVWGFLERSSNSESKFRIKSYAYLKFYRLFDFQHSSTSHRLCTQPLATLRVSVRDSTPSKYYRVYNLNSQIIELLFHIKFRRFWNRLRSGCER